MATATLPGANRRFFVPSRALRTKRPYCDVKATNDAGRSTTVRIYGPTVTDDGRVLEDETVAFLNRLDLSKEPVGLPYVIDKFVKRGKAGGWLSKATYIGGMARHPANAIVDFVAGLTGTIVGDPTRVNGAWSATNSQGVASNANYIDTGYVLPAAMQNDFSMYAYTAVQQQEQSVYVFGAIDGNASIGVAPFRNSGGAEFRVLGSTSARMLPARAQGVYGFSRTSSTDVRMDRDAFPGLATASIASVTPTTGSLRVLSPNGSTGYTTNRVGMTWVGHALTPEEYRSFYPAFRTLCEEIGWGCPNIYEIGEGPSSIGSPADPYDLIVYGATLQGLSCAYAAARQGKRVAIIGGWRERALGGVSTGGLSFVDLAQGSALPGGIGRALLNRKDVIGNKAEGQLVKFVPRTMLFTCRGIMDSTINGGFDVPIFWSEGYPTVSKDQAGRIISMTTADGRTAYGRYFADMTYETDLVAAHGGIDYTNYRESVAAVGDAASGYRGTTTGTQATLHNWIENSNRILVSPRLIDGDDSSPLLPHINMQPEGVNVGDQYGKMQGVNFRTTLVRNTSPSGTALYVPFPSSPPPGYDPAVYEIMIRMIVLKNVTGLSGIQGGYNILKADDCGDGGGGFAAGPLQYFDANAEGCFSIDYFHEFERYLNGTVAEREAYWEEVRNFILGWWYTLQYLDDPRLNGSAVRANALTYGLAADHYLDPHPNDPLHWMTHMYVREGRSIIGDIVLNVTGAPGTTPGLRGLQAADGTVPSYGTHTIGVMSYSADRHHSQRIVDTSTTPHSVWNEGGIFTSSTAFLGNDSTGPVPIRAMLPKRSQCTNLVVGFNVSCSRTAFGAYRMELTSADCSANIGVAVCQAIDRGITIHDIDDSDAEYDLLRARLLAQCTLGVTFATENPTNLPQVA